MYILQNINNFTIPWYKTKSFDTYNDESWIASFGMSKIRFILRESQFDFVINFSSPFRLINFVGLIFDSYSKITTIHLPLQPSGSGYVRISFTAKSQQAECYIFHFSLITLLVLEELRKIGRDWNTFLLLVGYYLEIMSSPSVRKGMPSSKG